MIGCMKCGTRFAQLIDRREKYDNHVIQHNINQEVIMSLVRWNPVYRPDYFGNFDSLIDSFFNRSGRYVAEQNTSLVPRINVAENDSVILAGIRKVSLPQRSVALYSDETYAVRWAGSGYAVFRKTDDVAMLSETYSSTEAAKIALLGLYPRKKRA